MVLALIFTKMVINSQDALKMGSFRDMECIILSIIRIWSQECGRIIFLRNAEKIFYLDEFKKITINQFYLIFKNL